MFFFFKQKTAYEMRISDWSSDVCSSDLKTRRSVDRDRAVSGAPVASPRLAGRSGPTHVCLGRGRLARLYRGTLRYQTDDDRGLRLEIGRASCRERVCQYV